MEDKKYNFTFINETGYGIYSSIPDHKLEYKVSSDTLHQIVSEFENFLRGCGFQIDGHLDIIYREED